MPSKNVSIKPTTDLKAVAKLRIQVFREPPYLYDGSLEYEERYLKKFLDCPEALILLAKDGDKVVGAATGIPLEFEDIDIRKPIENPEEYFYFSEFVLLPDYRGQGIGRCFFDMFEDYVHKLGRFKYTCFAAIERGELGKKKSGYIRHPELQATVSWKEVGEEEETPKNLTFWVRELS